MESSENLTEFNQDSYGCTYKHSFFHWVTEEKNTGKVDKLAYKPVFFRSRIWKDSPTGLTQSRERRK